MEIEDNWRCDVPRKWFSTPYSFTEKLSWLKNNLIRPSRKYSKLTKFIPQDYELNKVETKIRIGFIGDIMRMGRRELDFDQTLIDFFNDADYLVGNFEGTISAKKKVFMAQDHSEKILYDLEKLFKPDRFILGCANNHSGDFGWTEFENSYNLIKQHGFIPIGRRDEGSIVIDDLINLVAVTKWSNQPCRYVAKFDSRDAYYDAGAEFNILYPHWGYEMQLYPNPRQIQIGKDILNKWDLIIGHHPHVPQPITAYDINEQKKLLAYSLGNFCWNVKFRRYLNGMVVLISIGPTEDGTWAVGKVKWKFTKVEHINPESSIVKLVESCKYFKNIEYLD
ncbi:MAG: CapA family protein [Candidatus Helarchaeota archaeon]